MSKVADTGRFKTLALLYRRVIAGLVFAGCAIGAYPISGLHARQVGPTADICAEMNRVIPGEELVLLPGRYAGPCSIRAGGEPQRPIVIRSADLQRPAVLVYTGRTANVLDIKADHVVIRGLAFESVRPEADGIRIYARNDVVIEDCEFSNLGGIAVVANHHSARGIAVRRNVVKGSRATGMYFGCHDGKACVIDDLVIERNYIHGVAAPDPMVGYGIQVKLNSPSTIRDNIIVDVKGPGIMIYGSHSDNSVSMIERNFVQGSRNSAGIVIGGGPAKVYNNISVRNAHGGIQLQDYGKRGLLRDISIRHNTLFDNEHGALLLAGADRAEAEIVFNAFAGSADKAVLPGVRERLSLKDNRDCSHVSCFADPAQRDFTPLQSSILLGLRENQGDMSFPKDDFFGRLRGTSRAVGAVEPGGGPVNLGIKLAK